MRVRTALLGHGGPPEESIPRDLSVGVQALIRSAASSRHGDYRQPTPSLPGRRVRVVHGGVAEEDDTRGLEIRHGRAVFFRETEPLARLRSDLTSDYPRDYTVAQSVVDSYCGGDGSGRGRQPPSSSSFRDRHVVVVVRESWLLTWKCVKAEPHGTFLHALRPRQRHLASARASRCCG